MNHLIYYFSGTGNSLQVARVLGKKLGDTELVPMLSNIKNGAIAPEATCIGLVFPVHNFTLPAAVQSFLKTADLSQTEYIFAVATRGGSPCRVFIHLDRLLGKQGKKAQAFFYIDMPNNWLLLWDAPTAAERDTLFKGMEEKTDEIAGIVGRREEHRSYSHGNILLEHLLFPFLSALNRMTRYFFLDRAFYTNTSCDGCGICEKLCLSGKIGIKGGKPVWNPATRCLFCFACIHYCPREAIQFSHTKTPVRHRYHHPEVPWKALAEQKREG